MVIFIAVGIVFISIKLINGKNNDKYANLYIYNNRDSISLASQIVDNEHLLILYFHPECDFCHGELNLLSKLKTDNLVVDLVSYAHKNDIDSMLQTVNFQSLKEVNIIYDSSYVWNEVLNIVTIPTTFYFNKGHLKQKRIGYFDLKVLLNEE
ncbi:MAG: hypothetical protein MJ211_05110 [Bacteroidales bacterium]|nr:hypothetical protein [Bacteroidales bacterium]